MPKTTGRLDQHHIYVGLLRRMPKWLLTLAHRVLMHAFASRTREAQHLMIVGLGLRHRVNACDLGPSILEPLGTFDSGSWDVQNRVAVTFPDQKLAHAFWRGLPSATSA